MPTAGKMAAQDVPDIQRALVFQGAAAVGAYEAGVFQTLYQELRANPVEPGDNNVFDIIAGTSAGAINAAILVSCVQRDRNWDNAANVLLDYWTNHVAVQTPNSSIFPAAWYTAYDQWLNAFGGGIIGAASQEAARRYFSSKYFLANGVDTVYQPSQPFPRPDYRFFDNNLYDPTNNLWFNYDNSRLAAGLGSDYARGYPFIKFPISTSYDNREPRLLAVATEVQYGKGMVFDSYSTESKLYYPVPGSPTPASVQVNYPTGIKREHIMAGATVPLFYDCQKIGDRKFWDGGTLSNTPLRELIQAHADYWWARSGHTKIPKLQVYIVDVWPAEVPEVPQDHDALRTRFDDILACDKTDYDQRASFMVSDLIGLAKDLRDLANGLGAPPSVIADIMGQPASIKGRDGSRRTLGDLVNGGVILDKVVTIQKRFDPDSIANEWADDTIETITTLINEGRNFRTAGLVTQYP